MTRPTETTSVIACTAGGGTQLQRRATPTVSRGELLLGLRACGLCGTDLYKLAQASAPVGAVLGHELVGEVLDVGDAVRGFALGDRVVVPHHVACGECALCRRGSETLCDVFRENLLEPGGFSERVLVRERAVRLAAHRIPDTISDAAAVFLEPAACVLRGLKRSGLDRVPATAEPVGCALVIGGGSMGLLHLLVLGAWRPDLAVVLVDPLADRCALAERLGAAFTCAPGDGLAARIADATGGLGADAVFDTVGGAQVLDTALEALREGGSAVLFAHSQSDAAAGFDLNTLFKHERRVLGTYSGGRADQRDVFELIARGKLDAAPLVTHELPLERFAEGVELARAHRALKILFTPSASRPSA